MQEKDEFHPPLIKRKLYILLGDVISSRKIKNRDKFQNKLINAYSELNEMYGQDMYARLDIIKGSDEIGCALYQLNDLYEIISSMLTRLSPYDMRFVLVRGIIDTGLSTRKISQMDGPAFHEASNLMNLLKDEKLIFKMDTKNMAIDKLVANNINLIHLIKRKWSSKKIKIINEYEKNKDQRSIANKLELSPQVVSYNIKSANWKELNKIENDLKESLKIISWDTDEQYY